MRMWICWGPAHEDEEGHLGTLNQEATLGGRFGCQDRDQ